MNRFWKLVLAVLPWGRAPKPPMTFEQKFAELNSMDADWFGDGTAAPNQWAIETACCVVALLRECGIDIKPADISVTVEEGVYIGQQWSFGGIWFIEALNERAADLCVRVHSGECLRLIELMTDDELELDEAKVREAAEVLKECFAEAGVA